MKCVFCGGTLKREMITFTYDDDDQFILVEHVPAEVCPRCGEKLYTPEVTDVLLAFAKHPTEPVRIRHVPVYDFAAIRSNDNGDLLLPSEMRQAALDTGYED